MKEVGSVWQPMRGHKRVILRSATAKPLWVNHHTNLFGLPRLVSHFLAKASLSSEGLVGKIITCFGFHLGMNESFHLR